MRQLHICYVEGGYPHVHGGGGGAGTYVRLAGRELVRRGVRVSVVASWCPHCPPHVLDGGITVHRPVGRGRLHSYARKIPGLGGLSVAFRYLEDGWHWRGLLEQLHRRERFSLVEFTEGGDYWHAHAPSFPFVTHLHGSRYTFLARSAHRPGWGDWQQRRLEHGLIRRARCVFSPSRSLLELVRREVHGAMPPAVVLPYPLDPRLLEAGGGHVNGAVGGRATVFFAARNDPVKGAAVLLRAVPLVRGRVPDVRFVLVGHEPAADERLPDGVECLPFMPREQLLAHLRRATVAVVPSVWDNSPNTVYEAMAAGKPVVASRVGGIPELVANGETGLLVPPGDAGALAEAMCGLLKDYRRLDAMGRAGRRRIRELAGLEENVSRRLAVYERVAARRSVGARS